MADHHVDELLQAFRSRDWTQLQDLAATGVDVNGYDEDGLTALMHTAGDGENDVVQAILEAGAKTDLRSKTAVDASEAAATPTLGQRPPKHPKWDTEGKTALFLAAEKGHVGSVELLVDGGADQELEDRQGDTPLMIAANSGHAPVLAHLLASVASGKRTALADDILRAALEGGHGEAAALAIEAGASQDVIHGTGSSMTPLYAAALRGHNDLVKILIKAGADSTVAGARGIPLIAALRQGHKAAVRTLAGHHRVRGHDITEAAKALPLHIAVKDSPSAASLRRLVQLGFDVEAADPSLSTPLQLAAAGGHVEMIETLVGAGAAVDGVGKPKSGSAGKMPRDAGRSPLMQAALAGHAAAVEKLLQLGANPKRRIDSLDLLEEPTDPAARRTKDGRPMLRLSNEGCNALMLAAKAGHAAVVKLLIAADVDLECESPEGETAVASANRYGHQEVVDLLAEAGASTVALGPSNLIAAIQSGNLEECERLLASDVQPDVVVEDRQAGNRTALHIAAAAGHAEIADALLRAGADVKAQVVEGRAPFERTALHFAASLGHHEVVRILLRHGAQVDAQARAYEGPGETAVSMAAEAGHAEVIAVLAEAEANLAGVEGASRPLTIACGAGHTDAVHQLIQHGAPVAAGSQEALVEAANGGHLGVVDALLEASADANVFPPDHWSALTAAIANNHEKVVVRLLSAGADPDGGSSGLSPLDQAMMNGRLDLVKILVEAGANVNRQGSGGKTPLMEAVTFHPTAGNEVTPLLPVLVSNGANLDSQNEKGETALHLAIEQGKIGDANFLIEAGPDLSLADDTGRTVLSRALERGLLDMVTLLQSKGAATGNVDGPIQGDFTPREVETVNNRDLPIGERRGMDLEDADDTLVMIKAPLEAASRAFQLHRRAEVWERDVYGQEVPLTHRCFLSLRLNGHDWTIIRACYVDSEQAFANLTAEDAKTLSENVGAPAIFFLNSDNASVVGYTYFENGEEKERFLYDPEGGEWDAEETWEEDDEDEGDEASWEVEDEEGWEGPPPMFLSRLRQLETRQIDDPWDFCDRFLKDQGAFAASIESRKARPDKPFTLEFEGFGSEDFQRLDFIANR